MKTQSYQILDDTSVRRYRPKGKHPILIRLLDPYYQIIGIPYSLKYEDHYEAILEIYVDNIRRWSLKNEQRFTLFTQEMRNRILDFIDSHPFDELVVHCDQGEAKSPAVLMGIATHLGYTHWITQIQQNPHFLPNELILDLFQQKNAS